MFLKYQAMCSLVLVKAVVVVTLTMCLHHVLDHHHALTNSGSQQRGSAHCAAFT